MTTEHFLAQERQKTWSLRKKVLWRENVPVLAALLAGTIALLLCGALGAATGAGLWAVIAMNLVRWPIGGILDRTVTQEFLDAHKHDSRAMIRARSWYSAGTVLCMIPLGLIFGLISEVSPAFTLCVLLGAVLDFLLIRWYGSRLLREREAGQGPLPRNKS